MLLFAQSLHKLVNESRFLVINKHTVMKYSLKLANTLYYLHLSICHCDIKLEIYYYGK